MVTNEEGEIVLDPDGPDIPDQFTGDSIDAVTADQIREAAQRYLSVRRSVAGYLLPVDAEDPA